MREPSRAIGGQGARDIGGAGQRIDQCHGIQQGIVGALPQLRRGRMVGIPDQGNGATKRLPRGEMLIRREREASGPAIPYTTGPSAGQSCVAVSR